MENQTNIYKKYCPNVFVAKCYEQHEKGETIILTTKYGKENENEVHNFLGKTSDNFYLYSITRSDGFNHQERAKNKVEKLKGYSANAEKRSDEYYEKSQKHKDFLSLGEPIKVGHHSERRHRKLFEDNHRNMGKSIEESDKAKAYLNRTEYWESKASTINLSQPESLEFFEFKLEDAKNKHKNLKDNPNDRKHSFSLTYAKKEVNELTKKLNLAVKLWGSEEVINQINKEKTEQAEKKAFKTKAKEDLLKKLGGFFFFGSDTDEFKKRYNELLEKGIVEKGEKVQHVFCRFIYAL